MAGDGRERRGYRDDLRRGAPGECRDPCRRVAGRRTGTNSQEYGAITKSVRVWRNLVLFERGPNTYPSNHRFDLNHEEVGCVRDLIRHESTINASPGAYLTQIDMYRGAGRRETAMELAREALHAYPSSLEVLAFVRSLYDEFGAHDDRDQVQASIEAVLPNVALTSSS